MTMKPATRWTVGLIGYGEVGRILAEDLRAQGVSVCAYDIKLNDPATAEALIAHAAQHGVSLLADHAAVAAQSDLVISAVTASQTVLVAQAAAAGMQAGAFFLDFNSASPGAKQRAASLIDGAGGKYVEGAVMRCRCCWAALLPLNSRRCSVAWALLPRSPATTSVWPVPPKCAAA